MREFRQDHNFNNLVYRHRALFGLLAGIVVLASIIYVLGLRQRQNHDAILKSCILLNNKIIESQAASGASVILIQEILKLATEHGDRYVVIQYKKRIKGVPFNLANIDCMKVSAHPEDIKAIPSTVVTRIAVPEYRGKY